MRSLIVFSLMFLSLASGAQSVTDAAVQLTAAVQANPPQVTLGWPTNGTTTQYFVYRKLKTGTAWGAAIATLPGSATQYVDTVTAGQSYEYHVRRQGTNYNGYGYINCGVEVPETDFRGRLVLIVDSTWSDSLAPEIKRLIDDIEGDGWGVLRHDVLRTASVPHVKSLIVDDYTNNQDVRAVFLLGHVPVPYSGNMNPDGHPDHLGAWPADVYYGDIDGIWTDNLVTSTTASPARTQNVPGDGKFDQSLVPGSVELQVGRVDLSQLPAFGMSERQLLKKYLDKDHEYRKKIYLPQKRAVVDDNFGYFGSEAFAASAYKNFAPLTGSIVAGDYFTSMAAGSYLWSYGCGGGSFTSASGIGNTTAFTTASLQGVFTMLFGSYFGDWDVNNNFLRAPLAQGRTLTNMWSGRPHYALHHMGLGENIGYSLLMTQNYAGNLYYGSPTAITGKWIHNALMGDPTLRNDVVAPVSNVEAGISGNTLNVIWSASSETNVAGYNIYLKNDTTDTFVKLNSAPVTSTSFSSFCIPVLGTHTCMVRTLKLENTFSGSYYNMSEGVADTAYNSVNQNIHPDIQFAVSANSVIITNNTANASGFQWNFGNGDTSTAVNPVATYTANGTYTISYSAFNKCGSVQGSEVINITEVSLNENTPLTPAIFPNPSGGIVQVISPSPVTMSVFDLRGRLLYRHPSPITNEAVDLRGLPPGLYMAVFSGENISAVSKKLLISE
jgi:hypothetical protein